MAATRGASSPAWAKLYYSLFNHAYTRDQRAFLAGRVAYAESLRAPAGTMALLRRNIHRLEKGMLMRPMRTPFALDYIGETVQAYRTAAACSIDDLELAWARDVLSAYFYIHSGVEIVEPYQESFVSHPACELPGAKAVPYKRQVTDELPVDLDSLRRLARHRRSVRWFLSRPVARELIDRAVEVACEAPTACNRLPYEFRIFDDRALVQEILAISYGTTGFAQQVPVVAVVVGQQRHFFDERDRHLIYIDGSLAVMSLLMALEVQGLSSCCINWPDIESMEARMNSLLALEPDEHPIMLVAIGYADPDGLVAASKKKSIAQLRRYNFE
jgi:nitroreductase